MDIVLKTEYWSDLNARAAFKRFMRTIHGLDLSLWESGPGAGTMPTHPSRSSRVTRSWRVSASTCSTASSMDARRGSPRSRVSARCRMPAPGAKCGSRCVQSSSGRIVSNSSTIPFSRSPATRRWLGLAPSHELARCTGRCVSSVSRNCSRGLESHDPSSAPVRMSYDATSELLAAISRRLSSKKAITGIACQSPPSCHVPCRPSPGRCHRRRARWTSHTWISRSWNPADASSEPSGENARVYT